ncbi:MAG: AEC family transporter [Desulfobacterales bacterium]|nr:AEC family transporter [Desulfobacterales bacterium]
MLDIVSTILPIFAIIFLGWLVRHKGFVQPQLLGPANQLVYHVAIPALIFREISGASFKAQFNATVLACTLLPVLVVFALALAVGTVARIRGGRLGTFMQSSFHGNLGYIGLAVAYYFLGSEGFVRASIIAGFLMLLQNFLAVIALHLGSVSLLATPNLRFMLSRVVANPVILSALAGIVFSVSGIPVPLVMDRSLKILSGLALPLALLVIGASVSFELVRLHILSALGAGVLKLIVLPAMGYLLYQWFGVAARDYLPGLILLGAPTATLAYVMATEIKGDTDLAIAAISVNTMLSAITFTVWLGIAE